MQTLPNPNGMPEALEGVRVLDCSQILAGPFCSMLLADMGADVIKIEKPNGGDDTRRMGPPFIDTESAAFLAMNRNKRSIVLNFKEQSGVQAMKTLVKDADIVIENYRTGTMARLGLGYEDLKNINPSINKEQDLLARVGAIEHYKATKNISSPFIEETTPNEWLNQGRRNNLK